MRQHGHIVSIKHSHGKSDVTFHTAPLPITLSVLEGHFRYCKPF